MWFYISRLLAIEQFNLQLLLTDISPSVVQKDKYCVEFPSFKLFTFDPTPTETLGWHESRAETGIIF